MSFEITEKEYLMLVDKPRCRGTEIPNGNATEGHEKCGHCKGNYFVGGECNYGGCHTMIGDLKQINKNFRQFDVLVKRQLKISEAKSEDKFNKYKKKLIGDFADLKDKCESEDGKGFFFSSCVGAADSELDFAEKIKTNFRILVRQLSDYMTRVENTTWTQIKEFKEMMKKLDEAQKETSQLAKDYKAAKDRGDETEATRIFALLAAKEKEVASLQLDLKQNPLYDLFDGENTDLADIVKNIFYGSGQFFGFKKDKEEEDKKKQETEKYFGFIPKRWGKKILWISGGLGILLSVYFLYRWIRKHF